MKLEKWTASASQRASWMERTGVPMETGLLVNLTGTDMTEAMSAYERQDALNRLRKFEQEQPRHWRRGAAKARPGWAGGWQFWFACLAVSTLINSIAIFVLTFR